MAWFALDCSMGQIWRVPDISGFSVGGTQWEAELFDAKASGAHAEHLQAAVAGDPYTVFFKHNDRMVFSRLDIGQRRRARVWRAGGPTPALAP